MIDSSFHNRRQTSIRTAEAGCGTSKETPLRRDVTVNLTNGLHLEPCSQIARFVHDYPGTVFIQLQDERVNAKSILDLMTLRASGGTVLTLEVSGDQSESIVEGLVALFERNFAPIERKLEPE